MSLEIKNDNFEHFLHSQIYKLDPSDHSSFQAYQDNHSTSNNSIKKKKYRNDYTFFLIS